MAAAKSKQHTGVKIPLLSKNSIFDKNSSRDPWDYHEFWLQNCQKLSINLIIDKNSNFALVCQGTLGLNELDSSDMSVQFLEMCLPTMQPPLVSLAF